MSKPFQTAMIPPQMIVTGKQVRRQQATPEEDTQLLESVKRYDIMQPLGVKFEGKDYLLCWGHRRLSAALAAGLKEVPCVVLDKEMTEADFLAIQIQENITRTDISQFDLWQGAVRLMAASPGMTPGELGKLLSLNPPAVTRLLSASKVTPEWVQALKDGRVSLGDTYTASRLPMDQQNALLALRLNGATRDQLAAVQKKTRKPTDDAVKMSLVKLPLTSALTITVKGPDMTLSQLVDALTQAREAAQKSLKDSLDIRTAEKVWRDRAKAGA